MIDLEAWAHLAPEALIDAGLSAIAAADPGQRLLALALELEDRAATQPASFRGPAWRMLAGAAAARAVVPVHRRGSPAPDDLIADCDALQRQIDRDLPRSEALERFAPLGAALAGGALPRLIEQRIDTRGPDDTVYTWASGAAALGALRPEGRGG
jgi:hypothetical protein